MQVPLTSLYLTIKFQLNKHSEKFETPLADRTLTAAAIFHQVLDGLCHLYGEKEYLLYQQIPKFYSSVIDMCKGYDHQ